MIAELAHPDVKNVWRFHLDGEIKVWDLYLKKHTSTICILYMFTVHTSCSPSDGRCALLCPDRCGELFSWRTSQTVPHLYCHEAFLSESVTNKHCIHLILMVCSQSYRFKVPSKSELFVYELCETWGYIPIFDNHTCLLKPLKLFYFHHFAVQSPGATV